MNDDWLPDEDGEAGAPIAALAELRVTPGRRFRARLRGRIERRQVAADLARFAWQAPAEVALEILRALFTPRPAATDDKD